MRYKLKIIPINKSKLHVYENTYFLSKIETTTNELYNNTPISLIMVDKPFSKIERGEFYLNEKGLDIANEEIDSFDDVDKFSLPILAIYPSISNIKTFSNKFLKQWIKNPVFEISLKIKNNEIVL